MKILIVLSILIVITSSSVIHFGQPLYTAAIPVHTPPQTKLYHNQDSFGQYSYGYSGGPSIKSEQKTLDGITRGTYSYIDSDGHLQTVQYTADAEHGFRVAATNLPIAPTNDNKIIPEPVQDTPEVAKAKIDHLNAFREAEIRAAKDEHELDDNGMPMMTSNNNHNNNNNNGNNNSNEENDNNNNNNNNNNENIENHLIRENMRNINEESLPADTTRQLLSTLQYHDLRPVNIPIPSATSYIHVNTPAHSYSTRIYGPTRYSYSIPNSYTTYTKGITSELPQYYNSASGYWLENNNNNNGFDSVKNIGSNGHIIDDAHSSGIENMH